MTDISKKNIDLKKILEHAADVGAREALVLCHIKIDTFFEEAIDEVHKKIEENKQNE